MDTRDSPDLRDARIAQLEESIHGLEFDNGVLRLQFDVLTSTDIVTGLPNLVGMMEIVDNALARQSRSGEPFGLMSVEIPVLSEFDNAGDAATAQAALRHCGALIRAGLRDLDSVGRVDERSFLVTLPMLDRGQTEAGVLAGIETVIGRIGHLLSAVPFRVDDLAIHLQPVISVVVTSAETAAGAAVLIERLFAARQLAAVGQPVIDHASGQMLHG